MAQTPPVVARRVTGAPWPAPDALTVDYRDSDSRQHENGHLGFEPTYLGTYLVWSTMPVSTVPGRPGQKMSMRSRDRSRLAVALAGGWPAIIPRSMWASGAPLVQGGSTSTPSQAWYTRPGTRIIRAASSSRAPPDAGYHGRHFPSDGRTRPSTYILAHTGPGRMVKVPSRSLRQSDKTSPAALNSIIHCSFDRACAFRPP